MGDNREILTFRQKLSEEQEKGHRERLRQRFLSAGIKGFLDYELLELLLTYTVIRRNCRGIAKKLLEEAYVEIKNSVTPKFFDNLSDVVKTITNGKYVKVYVNDEIEVEDYLGKIYSIDNLSFGTIEEIYFSLRVSIALMISEEKFPIILDESFVYFDDNRLRSILNYLYSLDNQIIILSSNKREKNLLDFGNYDYNFIQL